MPRFNIFVRDEDLPLWESIEDRPRWVHDALRGTSREYPRIVKQRKEIEKLLEPRVNLTFCKHGADPEFCRHAKIKNGKKVCK